MKTLNMLRYAALALVSLTAIIACDNRGVTAMKARMYTPEERAQARAAIGSPRGSTASAPKGDAVTTPGQPAAAPKPDAPKPGSTDPTVKPNDKPEAKNFFEPIDATNQNAVIELARAKKIVEDQLGQVNEAAQQRVLGLTISNKSTPNASIIDIDAVVFFRGRQQTLNLSNIKVAVAAKDQVHGTSGVTVRNRTAANVDEQAQKPITTAELLVASVCLSEGPVCRHSYLIMQFGREDKSVDAAVFELDQNMVIQNSNIGMPVTSFQDALNAGISTNTRTRAQRLERLCKLRPTAPKCVAFRAETAASQASIATVSTPAPATATAPATAAKPAAAPATAAPSAAAASATQPITFQRAQASGNVPNTKPMSFLTPGNPWAVTPTAANANVSAKPATAPATPAPAAAKSSLTAAQLAQLKASAVKAIPRPTEVKVISVDPNQSMNRARDGSEKDLRPAAKPAATAAPAKTAGAATSSSTGRNAPMTTTSGTAEDVPWNWKLYNWFVNN